MSVPKISIITPTWKRHKMLLTRCIPSIQAQGYPNLEHIVVSDGPDSPLRETLDQPWRYGWKDLRYHELPAHDEDRHWGGPARLAGLELAIGDYTGYCDDDDSLRPDHCHRLAVALDADQAAGFAVSRMCSHGPSGETVIGEGELACGNVGTPMIMHRRWPLETATWDHAGQFEDWDLAWAWLRAGIPYVRVDAVTCDAWPSIWRGDGPDPEYPLPRRHHRNQEENHDRSHSRGAPPGPVPADRHLGRQ